MGGGCGNAKNVTHTTADSGKKSPAAASRRNTDVIERPDSDSQTESASLHAMQVSHMVGVDAAGMTRSILPGRPGAQHSESGPSRFRCYRCGTFRWGFKSYANNVCMYGSAHSDPVYVWLRSVDYEQDRL